MSRLMTATNSHLESALEKTASIVDEYSTDPDALARFHELLHAVVTQDCTIAWNGYDGFIVQWSSGFRYVYVEIMSDDEWALFETDDDGWPAINEDGDGLPDFDRVRQRIALVLAHVPEPLGAPL